MVEGFAEVLGEEVGGEGGFEAFGDAGEGRVGILEGFKMSQVCYKH